MTALAIIAEVGKLISEPSRWCQGHMAVNAKGEPCSPLRARRLDPIGATYAVTRIKLADDHVNRHTNDTPQHSRSCRAAPSGCTR